MNSIRCFLVGASLVLPFFCSGNLLAEVDNALQQEGWEEIVFDRKQANQFIARDDGGIGIVSNGSVSLLRRPVTIDIEAQPILRWRWSVTKAAPATPLSVKGADDRSLAIYVAFPFIAEEATAFERMERTIVEATVGKDAPGRILMYVWGGDEKPGTVIKSPYFGDSGMMKILHSANTPADHWFEESINIAGDYRSAFGTDAPDPVYIAISADTDDTKSVSRGTVLDLAFVDRARVF